MENELKLFNLQKEMQEMQLKFQEEMKVKASVDKEKKDQERKWETWLRIYLNHLSEMNLLCILSVLSSLLKQWNK